jgi:DNA primase
VASTVDLIKERLDIASVVGSYIKLEKAGINLKARCPFHNEKTPSFMISSGRGGYYCFGCGEKGDMFTFVEKFEGVDFKGALKILADKAGVPITNERSEDKSEKDGLYAVMEAAAKFFAKNLSENAKAKQYLLDRGLTEKTIEEFELGYAKNDWRDLLSHLRSLKFADAIIEKAGLVKKDAENKSKDFYDRFRGRIMFPIADSSGRVVAFSGRIFDDPKEGSVEPAKYINSPETPLFSKSKVLYGYDKSKDGIRKWGFTIVVEGQMDLLMSHQGGFKNTVAISGTALTPEHVSLLSRLSNKLVLALDSDEAGLKASGKSAALTLSQGLDVKVAKLSSGKDPAELVKADPELWKKAIRESKHIIDFYMDVVEGMHLEDRKFAQEVSRLVLPFVARIKSPIDRAHFTLRIAEKLHVPEKAVGEEVAELARATNDGVERFETVDMETKAEPESRGHFEIYRDRLHGLIIAEKTFKKGKFEVDKAIAELHKIVGSTVFSEEEVRDNVPANVLFEGEELYSSKDSLEDEINDLLLNLELIMLRGRFDKTMNELREKEKSKNAEDTKRLLEMCQELSQKIAALDVLLKK